MKTVFSSELNLLIFQGMFVSMTWSPSVQAMSAEVDRNLGASACSSGSSSFLDITKNAQSSAAFAPFFSFPPFRKMAAG
jgi:hypothetical protein